MGEIVQFVPRNTVTRRPMTDEARVAQIIAETWGVPSTLYESSLGFVAEDSPILAGILPPYEAPESDGA